MIRRVTLENFFSFGRATEIELSPHINILVGINGSGKSNFLKAIRLLFEAVSGEGLEKIFLRDWGGFFGVANLGQSSKDYIRLLFEFDGEAIGKKLNGLGFKFHQNPLYEIVIYRSGSTGYYLSEKLFTINDSGDKPFIFLEMENAKGRISTWENGKIAFQKYPQKESPVSFKSTELILRQISDPDRFYPLFTIRRALEEISFYDYFDTRLKSQLRQPGSYDTEPRLFFNGQNLMSLLIRLKNQNSLVYDQLEGYIRKINPHFKDISFDIQGANLLLFLREKNLSRSVSIEHISDGTLRYLLMLAIFINPERGSLVCMDEPETSLHPDMIHSVAELMKGTKKDNSQLIIATHSALLLNAFDLDEVLIFEKDESNQTVVKINSEEDFENWNDNFLVGQLWLRGLIGGKRW